MILGGRWWLLIGHVRHKFATKKFPSTDECGIFSKREGLPISTARVEILNHLF